MPEAFNRCVKNGGRMFTKSLPGGKYVHGCQIKGQKAVWGELKQKTEGGYSPVKGRK